MMNIEQGMLNVEVEGDALSEPRLVIRNNE